MAQDKPFIVAPNDTTTVTLVETADGEPMENYGPGDTLPVEVFITIKNCGFRPITISIEDADPSASLIHISRTVLSPEEEESERSFERLVRSLWELNDQKAEGDSVRTTHATPPHA